MASAVTGGSTPGIGRPRPSAAEQEQCQSGAWALAGQQAECPPRYCSSRSRSAPPPRPKMRSASSIAPALPFAALLARASERSPRQAEPAIMGLRLPAWVASTPAPPARDGQSGLFLGLQSRAIRCASAISSGVIWEGASSRSPIASGSCLAARFSRVAVGTSLSSREAMRSNVRRALPFSRGSSPHAIDAAEMRSWMSLSILDPSLQSIAITKRSVRRAPLASGGRSLHAILAAISRSATTSICGRTPDGVV